jgi:4-amino-4-deoxy-L-arabinose transferase-like glycosyltransferase
MKFYQKSFKELSAKILRFYLGSRNLINSNFSNPQNNAKDNSKTPLILLTIWVAILLIASNGQQSFMAHDEGYYFLQGRWIVESGDWITLRWWQQPEYDRTIGLQWVIALFYQISIVLGHLIPGLTPNFNEQITRLPNLISSIFASILVYQIARYWLKQSTAWLAGALLILSHLWLQYSRMGTQDVPLVAVELLLIFSLLKAVNSNPQNDCSDEVKINNQTININQEKRNFWLLIAGICVGIGFFIKSVMILLPCLALVPFFIYAGYKNQKIYRNWWLYSGLLLGFLPFTIWFSLSTQKYGTLPFEQLFGKLLILGKKAYHNDANIFYYFWNIPVNSLPWSLLALWQLTKYLYNLGRNFWQSVVIQNTTNQDQNPWQKLTGWCDSNLDFYHLIIWFYPLILWAELTVFSTRTAYYALQIYPWLAIWAGLGIEDITNQVSHGKKPISGKIFTYFLSFIGFVAVILSILISTNVIKTEGLLPLITPALTVLGIGWVSLIYWWYRDQQNKQGQNKQEQNWQAALLLSTWLGLAMVGFTGVLGNYSPDLKLALQKPEIANILNQNQIYFVTPKEVDGEEHKTWVLLGCYTPKLGQYLPDLSLLMPKGYAWIYPSLVPIAETNGFNKLATVKGWGLMQKSR